MLSLKFHLMSHSILEIQKKIIEDFSWFDNWEDKYQYIIDLGRKLPVLDNSLRTEKNKIKGCQSQVWLTYSVEKNRIYFSAASDAAIVSGLITILLQVFSGQTAEDITEAPISFIDEIELSQHLSPTRSNGLAAMLTRIREIAQNNLS